MLYEESTKKNSIIEYAEVWVEGSIHLHLS